MAILSQPASSAWAPFRIAPWFAERVWGDRDLRPWYDVTAQAEPLGEAWLTGDQCIAATGVHAGQTLGALFAEYPGELLGKSAPRSGSPLLIKVIFAREKLSVQVHPDDGMARKYGAPRGKTECWYALGAEPGAQVACGLKPGVTLDQVKAGIEAGTLEESLNVLDVTRGEMIFVDAGTVHAIWPGSILLEIQQNCDLTYRMYDYGRGRELHIAKSMEATRLTTRAGKIPPKTLMGRTILMESEYFCVERIPVDGSIAATSLADPCLPGEDQPPSNLQAPGLQYLFAAGGTARLAGLGFEAVELPRGGIVAVPAASPEFVVEDLGGLELIRVTPCRPEQSR